MRIITNEDLGKIVPCTKVDINPYCQVARRGYNISCDKCREKRYWELFWRQDNRRTSS